MDIVSELFNEAIVVSALSLAASAESLFRPKHLLFRAEACVVSAELFSAEVGPKLYASVSLNFGPKPNSFSRSGSEASCFGPLY